MRRIIDVIGAIIISLEFVFGTGFALLVYLEPSIFISLASRVKTTDELLIYFAIVPLAVTGYMLRQKDELLFLPQHPLSTRLQTWPGYHLLFDRYWISVMWGGLSSLSTLWVWIFGGDLTEYITFSFFFGSIIVSLITGLTFFVATITLKRILSTTPTPNIPT